MLSLSSDALDQLDLVDHESRLYARQSHTHLRAHILHPDPTFMSLEMRVHRGWGVISVYLIGA